MGEVVDLGHDCFAAAGEGVVFGEAALIRKYGERVALLVQTAQDSGHVRVEEHPVVFVSGECVSWKRSRRSSASSRHNDFCF